jgi:hypothetical protein
MTGKNQSNIHVFHFVIRCAAYAVQGCTGGSGGLQLGLFGPNSDVTSEV